VLKRNTRPSTLCQLPTASPADSHSESLNCRRGGLADASEKIFFPITQRQNLLVNALRVTNKAIGCLTKMSRKGYHRASSLRTATRWMNGSDTQPVRWRSVVKLTFQINPLLKMCLLRSRLPDGPTSCLWFINREAPYHG